MNLAFSATDPNVLRDRWIASLSDGRTVFQDVTPGIPSAWRRLQKFVRNQGITLTGLRLQAFARTVIVPVPDDSRIDGYWQASKLETTVGLDKNTEVLSRGIGVIIDGFVHIRWIKQDGNIQPEKRPYDPSKDLAGILHEPN